MKQVQAGTDISVDEIRISPYHFRKETVREKLEGLARSMRELGQIHNVSVVKGPRGGFELANGHRRLLAEKRVFVLKEELGTRPRFFYYFDN